MFGFRAKKQVSRPSLKGRKTTQKVGRTKVRRRTSQRLLPCKNNKKLFYSGKEKSPRGRGYSATGFPVGTVRMGKDKKKWIVKTTSNGKKRWTRVVNAQKRRDNDAVDAKIKELMANGYNRRRAVAVALKMKAAGTLGKKRRSIKKKSS